MKSARYWKTVHAHNNMSDNPSEANSVDEGMFASELIHHNVKVFNHFFAKG